jgi:hypothetical protein
MELVVSGDWYLTGDGTALFQDRPVLQEFASADKNTAALIRGTSAFSSSELPDKQTVEKSRYADLRMETSL